jgi:hypothetical protein
VHHWLKRRNTRGKETHVDDDDDNNNNNAKIVPVASRENLYTE